MAFFRPRATFGLLGNFLKTTTTAVVGLILGDSGGPPVQAGELARDGASLKWHDGSRVVSLDRADSFTKAGLPAAGSAGRLARVTDDVRGLWMDQGAQWFSLSGEVINVKEYGARGDGVADDTDAIQSAFNAVPASDTVVLIPPGEYKVSASLSITRGMILAGPGSGHSSGATAVLRTTSATNDVLRVATTEGVVIRDISIGTSVTRTAGAGIAIVGSGGLINTRTRITNVYMQGMYDAVRVDAGRFWVIDRCVLDQVTHHGIYVKQGGFTDEGDNVITNNVIVLSSGATGSGVVWEQGGALWVYGNKLFQGKYGVQVNLQNGPTGTLLIQGNSIEQQQNGGIIVQQGVAGKTMGNVSIIGNQLSIIAPPTPTNPTIYIAPGLSTPWLFRVSVVGNIINNNHTVNLDGIEVSDGQQVLIANNLIDQNGNAVPGGIKVGPNATKVQVIANSFNVAAGNKYKNGLTPNTILVDHDGLTAAQLGGFANGSLVYCSDCTIANPCTGGGSGAFAKRIGGAWVCN
jgi:hypothetical protein